MDVSHSHILLGLTIWGAIQYLEEVELVGRADLAVVIACWFRYLGSVCWCYQENKKL